MGDEGIGPSTSVLGTHFHIFFIDLRSIALVGPEGIGPSTSVLSGRRSTTELWTHQSDVQDGPDKLFLKIIYRGSSIAKLSGRSLPAQAGTTAAHLSVGEPRPFGAGTNHPEYYLQF